MRLQALWIPWKTEFRQNSDGAALAANPAIAARWGGSGTGPRLLVWLFGSWARSYWGHNLPPWLRIAACDFLIDSVAGEIAAGGRPLAPLPREPQLGIIPNFLYNNS